MSRRCRIWKDNEFYETYIPGPCTFRKASETYGMERNANNHYHLQAFSQSTEQSIPWPDHSPIRYRPHNYVKNKAAPDPQAPVRRPPPGTLYPVTVFTSPYNPYPFLPAQIPNKTPPTPIAKIGGTP